MLTLREERTARRSFFTVLRGARRRASCVVRRASCVVRRASSEQNEFLVVDVEHERVEQLRDARFVDLVMRIDHDVLDRRAIQRDAPAGLRCGSGRRGGFGVVGVFGECALCIERPGHRRQAEPTGEIAGVFENVFQRRGGRGDGRHGYCGGNGTGVNTPEPRCGGCTSVSAQQRRSCRARRDYAKFVCARSARRELSVNERMRYRTPLFTR